MTLEDWYRQIEENPIDWNLRSVFADWLDDRGLTTLAFGQRWQIQHQRTPQRGMYVAGRLLNDWADWYLVTKQAWEDSGKPELWQYMWLEPSITNEWKWSDLSRLLHFSSLQAIEGVLAEVVERVSQKENKREVSIENW